MMQAMADSYSKEYEKLKVENKDLKEELSAANQLKRSAEMRQQKQLSSGGPTSPVKIIFSFNIQSDIPQNVFK